MLVMFFMFHILVLFTVQVYETNSAPRGFNYPALASFSKRNDRAPSFRDGSSSHNASDLRTQSMFKILSNFTGSGNNDLKSNVFDKMLSNEMLSIKQRFFEKDLILSSTLNNIKHGAAPTPTIEVQQKWSVVDLFTKPVLEEVSKRSSDLDNELIPSSDNSVVDLMPDGIKNENNNISANKILELRSLPSLRHAETDIQHISSKCICTRQFQDHQRCTHTSTESSVQYTVYPLYLQPYQTYFYSDTIENPYENTYYHPKVIDDIKLPKKSKRRKTTPQSVELYYEDIDDNKSKEVDDHPVLNPLKRKERPKIIMNVDYDLVDENPKLIQSNDKKSDRDVDRFHIIKDLDEMFNNGIKKKCFCSQSTLIMPDGKNTLYVTLIASVINFHQKLVLLE